MESKKYRFFFFTATAALLTDQMSKHFVAGFLKEIDSSFRVFSFFSLTLVKNPGISFGMFSDWNIRYFIAAFSMLIAAFIILYARKIPVKKKRLHVALGLIEGGILGNMIDRLRVGAVIDFMNFHVWPVFNLADVFIVSGICLIFLDHIRSKNVP